jgi:hypothetical protein
VNFLVADPGHWFDRENLKAIFSVKDPRNFPESINTRRRFARRASFSTKPSEEICATADDPPMNLSKALVALKEVIPSMPIGPKEDAYVRELLAMLYSGSGTAGRSIRSWLDIEVLSELLLNRVFYPYSILKSEKPEDAPKRAAFTLLIRSIQAALGAFMVGIHFDAKTDEKRAHLLGRQLLEQAGYADRERPLNVANERAILTAQKAFVEDPKWGSLRRPRSSSRQRAQENTYAKIQENENSNTILEFQRRVQKRLEKYDKDRGEIDAKFKALEEEVKALTKSETLTAYFIYSSPQYKINIQVMHEIELKRDLARIQSYISNLETSLKKASNDYEDFYHNYPTESVHIMAFLKSQLDRLGEYVKQLKEIEGSIQKRIQELERAPKPVAKPAVAKPVAPNNRSRKNTSSSRPTWNEKELLKWRVEWLAGERNPKRDEVRIKQWSVYRSGLTAPQREAQNKNITRRVNRRA